MPMRRPRTGWTHEQVPASVGEWLGAMSRRIGVPVHRVLRVLLDRYVERLPAGARRRLTERLARQSRRPQ